MGIWGNPAATKKIFVLILGVHLHPVHPPAYATGSVKLVATAGLKPSPPLPPGERNGVSEFTHRRRPPNCKETPMIHNPSKNPPKSNRFLLGPCPARPRNFIKTRLLLFVDLSRMYTEGQMRKHDLHVGGDKTHIAPTNNVPSPLAGSLEFKRTRRKTSNTWFC